MNDPHDDLDKLIDRISDGTIDREQFSELEARLLEDPALRRRFRSRMRLEANLHSECQATPAEILSPAMMASHRPSLFRWAVPVAAGIAAMLALAAFLIFRPAAGDDPDYVATIVSEEGAAWSADGMIGEGARLVPGTMRLEKGLASLRFESGAVADLEAPVTIELLDPMRCRLSRGKAVFEMPESAQGFVVETPNGHAVDHGTRFAVSLEEGSDQVEFGVLSGRISVHHDGTQSSADVLRGDRVVLTQSGIGDAAAADPSPSERTTNSGLLRFRTDGRETSIVHGDMREDFLESELLMVKRDIPVSNEQGLDPILWSKDRRALVAFDLDGLDPRELEQAALRLNLVPSGRGYAYLLPESTTIEVYGIRDVPDLEHWDSTGLKWVDAPGSVGEGAELDKSEVSLLGSFEIERSRLEGPVVFESAELTRFVSQDRTGVVGFLLASSSMPKDSWSLVHAFASSQHPEAAGPMLEVRTRQ
ncbi:FecR domain-containing protein [Haloferula sp. A504]|uniref:FecR domain-containing protein n=1 Tax=Haloferula sp. A504 TaxID=3373601 RepID=UPI0031BC6D85|nr:FecR domain-containing protein [Verrucomicrobiaceae bacterium E54]